MTLHEALASILWVNLKNQSHNFFIRLYTHKTFTQLAVFKNARSKNCQVQLFVMTLTSIEKEAQRQVTRHSVNRQQCKRHENTSNNIEAVKITISVAYT